MRPARLLLTGNLGGTNVGDSFAHAAKELGLDVRVVETRLAFAGPRLWRAVSWRLLGRRPPALRRYNQLVRQAVAEFRPDILLTTGVSPVLRETLAVARAAGAATANYPTDDPWNPVHAGRRYLRSLPLYDWVFTPRRANLDDFRAAGARHVEYLPFAYDPRFAHPEAVPTEAERPDLLFVGGGDADRFALLRPALDAGLRLTICGSFWEPEPRLRAVCRGQKGPDEVRRLTAAAKVCLCLVRRANRDGHVMRTYEAAAVGGGCLLAEDTAEHRDILGDTAVYFRDSCQMIDQARALVGDDRRRARLAAAARERVTSGGNTYRDRLQTIMRTVGRN